MTAKSSKPSKQPTGILAAIREAFAKGIQTVPDMEAHLVKLKVKTSPATVRTQMGKLRREAGLTEERKENGPVAWVKFLFESGAHTVEDVLEGAKENGVELNLATVRTQVGKLRREAGMTKK